LRPELGGKLAKPDDSLDPITGLRLEQKLLVRKEALVIRVPCFRVPEMEQRRAGSWEATTQAKPSQAHYEVNVLATPTLESHVPAAHVFEVTAQHTAEEAARRAEVSLIGPPRPTSVSKRYEVPGPSNLSASADHPRRGRPPPDSKLPAEHTGGEALAQIDALRGKKPSGESRSPD
jgi:hypothetical protein